MEPVTAADVRAALEVLSSLDPSTTILAPSGDDMTVAELFRGRSVDELVGSFEEESDQEEGRWIVELARPHTESKMPWGWILFGTAAALGGTWLAVRLIKNGS